MPPTVTLLTRRDGESWSSLMQRVQAEKHQVLVVLQKGEIILHREEEEFRAFLEACAATNKRVRIATRQTDIQAAAREKDIPVLDRFALVAKAVEGNDQEDEFLRIFSPHVWQQELRLRLQSMGLLSLPKIRIFTLIFVSAILFFFVVFKLLPSAEVTIWPREDTVTQTANFFLVLSGATVELPERVRKLELKPIVVTVTKSTPFDSISKQFQGESARVHMTVINHASEEYSLRKGSRLTNQAGMIFRLQESVILQSGEEQTVLAVADDLDLYGEIIGERGNIPANKRWEFAGLTKEEQALVYAENRVAATGGTTSYRTVLAEEDLQVAKAKLEEELAALARQQSEEERILYNAEHPDKRLEMLNYEELTHTEYHDFSLPTQFLGTEVTTVPVEGSLTYTSYAYDAQHILEELHEQLADHVTEGKRLLDHTVDFTRLVVHVIDYEDDLSWIKLTVDLSGTEQSVLDPLTPAGAKLAKRIRELIVGKNKDEADGIIKNLPDIEKLEISIWPPWTKTLPAIPSHITITPESNQ